MRKIESFISIWGRNWLNGRYLIPILEKWGCGERGIVLDLGCGQSPFRHFFSHAQQYICMDRIPAGEGVIVADIRKIPRADRSVDTVLLFQVLADLPEPEACLSDIARVLKLGGSLVVFESMCYPEHDLPHDYFRIMPSGLEYIARKTGFRSVETIRLGGIFTRFAMLWNSFLMGKLHAHPVLRPLSLVGILSCNVLCYALDRIAPYPSLASDYVARFVKE